jgi:hypothetical protein
MVHPLGGVYLFVPCFCAFCPPPVQKVQMGTMYLLYPHLPLVISKADAQT